MSPSEIRHKWKPTDYSTLIHPRLRGQTLFLGQKHPCHFVRDQLLMVVEQTLSIIGLLLSDPNKIIAGRSEKAPLIINTPIEQLGIYLLNIFPPQDQIFWSFGVFLEGDKNNRELADLVQTPGIKVLKRLQRELGVKEKTISSYEFFGPLTRREGLKFYPYNEKTPIPYWYFSQRHISLVIPMDMYKKYIDYFSLQIDQFAKESFRIVSEKQSLVPTDKVKQLDGYGCFLKNLQNMSFSERNKITKSMGTRSWSQDVDPFIKLVIGCRGVDFSLPFPLREDERNAITNIILKRINIAFSFSCLPVLEKLPGALESKGWDSLSSEKIDFIKKINERLSNYPVIENFQGITNNNQDVTH